jgi:hypothetical protein
MSVVGRGDEHAGAEGVAINYKLVVICGFESV